MANVAKDLVVSVILLSVSDFANFTFVKLHFCFTTTSDSKISR